MAKKGFTVIEILITLGITILLTGTLIQIFKPTIYGQKTRDSKRIADLKMLESAIRIYILSTSSTILGPTTTGYEESMPTIFVSIPSDQENVPNTYTEGGKNFRIGRASSSNYMKNNGQGWLPIDFSSMMYPSLTSLPVDPINNYLKGKFFYSYVFRRSDSKFEINAKLESEIYNQGGSDDRVSTDSGNNNSVYEVGTNKNLVILDLLYQGLE